MTELFYCPKCGQAAPYIFKKVNVVLTTAINVDNKTVLSEAEAGRYDCGSICILCKESLNQEPAAYKINVIHESEDYEDLYLNADDVARIVENENLSNR